VVIFYTDMYTNSHKKFQHEDLALTVWRFS